MTPKPFKISSSLSLILPSHQIHTSHPFDGASHALVIVLVDECLHLVAVGSQDVVFAAAEVGVDLAGQESILGDVILAAVVVERQQQEPDETDENAEERQIGGQLEDPGIASQGEGRCWGGGALSVAVSWTRELNG